MGKKFRLICNDKDVNVTSIKAGKIPKKDKSIKGRGPRLPMSVLDFKDIGVQGPVVDLKPREKNWWENPKDPA
jgi:hypothetical protein